MQMICSEHKLVVIVQANFEAKLLEIFHTMDSKVTGNRGNQIQESDSVTNKILYQEAAFSSNYLFLYEKWWLSLKDLSFYSVTDFP